MPLENQNIANQVTAVMVLCLFSEKIIYALLKPQVEELHGCQKLDQIYSKHIRLQAKDRQTDKRHTVTRQTINCVGKQTGRKLCVGTQAVREDVDILVSLGAPCHSQDCALPVSFLVIAA